MLPITRFLEENKLTYCIRGWCLGHMRNKCQAAVDRCRICLQEITDIQMHKCSQRQRCGQCDGNHHSLSSQCEAIKAYTIQLKEEVGNALARGVKRRSEPTKQVSIFNPYDFPPLSQPNPNNLPVWGSKQFPKHQATSEHTAVTDVLTALNKELLIMTETNIRMEKKLEEIDIRRTHDAGVLELLQKTMKNALHSIREVMGMMAIPLCDLTRIKATRKHLPFTIIPEELQAGISTKESRKVPDLQKDGETNEDIIALLASNSTNLQ